MVAHVWNSCVWEAETNRYWDLMAHKARWIASWRETPRFPLVSMCIRMHTYLCTHMHTHKRSKHRQNEGKEIFLSHVQNILPNFSNFTRLGITFVFQANMSNFPKSNTMFYSSVVSCHPSLSRGSKLLRGLLEQLKRVTNCSGLACWYPTLSESSPTRILCYSLEVLFLYNSCFSRWLLAPLFLSSNHRQMSLPLSCLSIP